jgi:predicted anti-sigma-YlaC factor YlaD
MKNPIKEVYISGYLDGELTELEQNDIEDHLLTCTSCSALVDDIKYAIQQIRQLKILMGDGEAGKIGAQIQKEISPAP